MFSFDIFETTLLRDVLTPTDLFYRVGAEAIERDEATTPINLRHFVHLRIQAEQIARAESSRAESFCEETTLEAIWQNLVRLLGWDWTPEWMQIEMDVEAAALRPIETTRKRIEAARAKDGRVLFISDQYLPAPFLKAQLQRFHLFQENDRLYLSSEVGLSKSSGNLFRHVLVQEGISASQLHHFGDNLHTDIKMARSIGIEATLCTVPELTDNETALVDTNEIDSLLLRNVVGASRQFRHSLGSGQDTGIQELTGSFLGPFCTLFAAWALQSAQKQGLKRLYFCARECQMIWIAAKFLAPMYGNIDCRYLYISRQALQLPSVTICNRKEMPWLRPNFEKPVLNRILSKLELTVADLPDDIGIRTEEGIVLNEEEEERLWITLESSPLKDTVEELARKRRESTLAYFTNEGLFEFDEVGIVDFSWMLTCQTSLLKIVRANGYLGKLHGYYLGLHRDRQPPIMTGPTSAIFYDLPTTLDHFKPIFGNVTLLEHLFRQATHPTTIRYSMDPEPKPVFQNAKYDSETEARISALHEEVARYTTVHKTILSPELLDLKELQLVLCALVDSYFHYGSKDAILALNHISVSLDQINKDSQSLIHSLSWADAIKEMVPGRILKNRNSPIMDDSLDLGVRYASSPGVYALFSGVRQMINGAKLVKRHLRKSSRF